MTPANGSFNIAGNFDLYDDSSISLANATEEFSFFNSVIETKKSAISLSNLPLWQAVITSPYCSLK